MTIPKTLQRFSSKIQSMDDERDTQNGYWIYLRRGWKSGNDPIGCVHQEHEDTLTALVGRMYSVLPCDCAECLDQQVFTG